MRSTYIHTFCMLRFRELGISMTSVATFLGVTPQHVSQVLLGRCTSAPVQAGIAKILGYDSWTDLDQVALTFSAIFPSIYNKPKKANVVVHEPEVAEHVG